jgi:DNA-binding MarR family transcriptional regulator
METNSGEPTGRGIKRRKAELAAAVMDYLAEHPHATDTVQGIAEWWVMRQQVRVDVETLVKVVQKLADEGLIERLDSPNGPLYRLRRKSR